MTGSDFFLAHDSRYKPVARRLREELEALGAVVWMDEGDLAPGDDWSEEIPKAQRASRCTLALISPGCGEARYFQREMKLAAELRRPAAGKVCEHRVIPILLDKTDATEIPAPFRTLRPLALPSGGEKDVARAVSSLEPRFLTRSEAVLDRYVEVLRTRLDHASERGIWAPRQATRPDRPLMELFVVPPVRVETETGATAPRKIDALQRHGRVDRRAAGLLRDAARRAGESAPRGAVAVDTLLDGGGHLCFQGRAGCGKSTLLAWAAIQAADAWLKTRAQRKDAPPAAGRLAPVHVPARALVAAEGDGPFTLTRLVATHLEREPVEGLPDAFRQALHRNAVVLFVDGLDEVARPEVRRSLGRALEEFSALHSDVPVRVATRPSESARLGRGFRAIELLPFGWQEAERFFRTRLGPPIADRLLDDLRFDKGRRALLETPLALLLLCSRVQDGGALPDSRAELFEGALRTRAERWPEETGRVGGRDPERHVALWSEVALALRRTWGSGAIPREDLLGAIGSGLSALGEASADRRDWFLDALVRIGLLDEIDADRHYAFASAVGSEYLAARAAARRWPWEVEFLGSLREDEAQWEVLRLAVLRLRDRGARKAAAEALRAIREAPPTPAERVRWAPLRAEAACLIDLPSFGRRRLEVVTELAETCRRYPFRPLETALAELLDALPAIWTPPEELVRLLVPRTGSANAKLRSASLARLCRAAPHSDDAADACRRAWSQGGGQSSDTMFAVLGTLAKDKSAEVWAACIDHTPWMRFHAEEVRLALEAACGPAGAPPPRELLEAVRNPPAPWPVDPAWDEFLLGHFGGFEAVVRAAWEPLLDDPDPTARLRAYDALLRCLPDAPPPFPILRDLLDHPATREAAARRLSDRDERAQADDTGPSEAVSGKPPAGQARPEGVVPRPPVVRRRKGGGSPQSVGDAEPEASEAAADLLASLESLLYERSLLEGGRPTRAFVELLGWVELGRLAPAQPEALRGVEAVLRRTLPAAVLAGRQHPRAKRRRGRSPNLLSCELLADAWLGAPARWRILLAALPELDEAERASAAEQLGRLSRSEPHLADEDADLVLALSARGETDDELAAAVRARIWRAGQPNAVGTEGLPPELLLQVYGLEGE